MARDVHSALRCRASSARSTSAFPKLRRRSLDDKRADADADANADADDAKPEDGEQRRDDKALRSTR